MTMQWMPLWLYVLLRRTRLGHWCEYHDDYCALPGLHRGRQRKDRS